MFAERILLCCQVLTSRLMLFLPPFPKGQSYKYTPPLPARLVNEVSEDTPVLHPFTHSVFMSPLSL